MSFIINNCRIDFLVPENIKNDILFMFLSYFFCKNMGRIRFSGFDGGHLGFLTF